MNIQNAHRLALWLAVHEPALFARLEHSAGVHAAMQPVTKPISGMSLGSFWSSLSSDLSSVGSSIGGAVTSVGNYLSSPAGASTLSNLANAYVKINATNQSAQLQNNVLQAQIARTNAGLSPAPVTYQQNAQGQMVPVYAGASGTYGITTGNVGSLFPSFMQKYGLYVAGAGVLLIGVLLLRK